MAIKVQDHLFVDALSCLFVIWLMFYYLAISIGCLFLFLENLDIGGCLSSNMSLALARSYKLLISQIQDACYIPYIYVQSSLKTRSQFLSMTPSLSLLNFLVVGPWHSFSFYMLGKSSSELLFSLLQSWSKSEPLGGSSLTSRCQNFIKRRSAFVRSSLNSVFKTLPCCTIFTISREFNNLC